MEQEQNAVNTIENKGLGADLESKDGGNAAALNDKQEDVNTNSDIGSNDNAADSADKNEGDEKETDKQDNEIYGSPESFDYSSVKLPEGMELDKELLDKFEPIAKKFNLSNQSANELMNIAVELTTKATSKFSEFMKTAQQAKINSYHELLNTDKELNAVDEARYNQYLDVAIQGLKAVATPGFSELLKAEGLTHHPEFIKTFHKIGVLCASEKIPDVKYPAGQKEIDPADVLFG